MNLNGKPMDYSALPEHMQGAMKRYMEHGIEPGSFLMAILTNDLMGAFGRADHINRERIGDYCQWLYNNSPAGSHGSRESVNAWMKRRLTEESSP